MSGRGHYGANGVAYVGQAPTRQSTVYVERDRSSLPLVLGAISLGASLLWARHQSRQIEQISKASGIPYKSFTSDLRERARSLAAWVARKPAREGKSEG